jgi:high-affinity Fe2+/Pb2+ permease
MKSGDLGIVIAMVCCATAAAVVAAVLVMLGLERIGLAQKLLCSGPWAVMLFTALMGLVWACEKIRRG